MNSPPSFSNKLLALYSLSFIATIAALVVDIERREVFFGFLGLVGSLMMTTLLIYRMARAMAFSPTVARLEPEPARMPPGEQESST